MPTGHYIRKRRFDFDPSMACNFSKTIAGNVVDGHGGCLVWVGRRHKDGYAVVSYGREVPVHRVACEVKNGLPHGTSVIACHKCDNASCVNPDHLYWGSRRDNSRDFIERDGKSLARLKRQGKEQSCERHPMAKLKNEDVKLILRVVGKIPRREIAQLFDVSIGTINLIATGKTWRHL
jgi:hypothetical protein